MYDKNMAAGCLLVLGLIFTSACNRGIETQEKAGSNQAADSSQYVVNAEKSFLYGYPAWNADSTINVVVEIPAGTTQKWEVTKPDGRLRWEFRDDKPRVVRYLGYPGNYGMVPRTLLPKELGGDGDPVDVIVLGHAVERGSVIRARLVGVLRLLDRGEQDDKLLAVMQDTPFFDVDDLLELQTQFPGVTEILELWFVNYKGPGMMQSLGFVGAADARQILTTAEQAFHSHLQTTNRAK